jgi:hypothetical protein
LHPCRAAAVAKLLSPPLHCRRCHCRRQCRCTAAANAVLPPLMSKPLPSFFVIVVAFIVVVSIAVDATTFS